MNNMPVQTQESKRAGMDAFLGIFEEFESAMATRGLSLYEGFSASERITLFGIYVGRME